MKYRPEIDGLRALAVLPVIFFHAGFSWFSGGYVGVDIFFVISGYLITTIIINEMDGSRFYLLNFYERRARRILPALFFVMLVATPLAIYSLTPYGLKEFGQSLISTSTFSSNILFFLKSGYFETSAELKPLIHTWSLAVEEQYYILFPLLLMITKAWNRKLMFFFLCLMFLASLSLAHWATVYSQDPQVISASFFLLPTRGWELLLGVAAAFYIQAGNTIQSSFLKQFAGIAGLFLIIFSISAFDKYTPFPSLFTLAPTLGALLLILGATQGTWAYKILSSRSIVFLGLISYSTYLWHQPIFAFSRQIMLGELSEITLLLLSFFSIGMGYLSWKWIEQPFRDKKRFSQISIFILSGSFMIFISAVGFGIHKTNGLEDELTEIYLSMGAPLLLDVTKERLLLNEVNNLQEKNPPTQRFSCAQNCQKLLVLGDSLGQDTFRSLVAAAKKPTEVRYIYIDDMCLFKIKTRADLENSNQCHTSKIINSLLENADSIILASKWEPATLIGTSQFIELLKQNYNSKIFVVGSIVFSSLESTSIKLYRNGYEQSDLAKIVYETQRWDLTEASNHLRGLIGLKKDIYWIEKSDFFCSHDKRECNLFDSSGNPKIWDHVHLTTRSYALFGQYLYDHLYENEA